MSCFIASKQYDSHYCSVIIAHCQPSFSTTLFINYFRIRRPHVAANETI